MKLILHSNQPLVKYSDLSVFLLSPTSQDIRTWEYAGRNDVNVDIGLVHPARTIGPMRGSSPAFFACFPRLKSPELEGFSAMCVPCN